MALQRHPLRHRCDDETEIMKDQIFLIGLPASGKTTLGRALAKKIGHAFIDLDEEIEKREGKSIPDFISFQGQGNFRIREKELLHEICSNSQKFVMATGGGTPCFHFNMDFMNAQGTTVYLDVSPGDLALRVMDQGLEKRPLLTSYDLSDLIQEIRELKGDREEFYLASTVRINENQINEDMVFALLD